MKPSFFCFKNLTFEKCGWDDASWISLCQGVANSSTLQNLRLRGDGVWYRLSSVDKAAKATERTNLLLSAMETNTSLVHIVFFGDSCDAALWKEKAPELIKRNCIHSIANAPASIQRQLLRKCQDHSVIKENKASYVYMALKASAWNDDLLSRIKTLTSKK
jgi:hypothetical protein